MAIVTETGLWSSLAPYVEAQSRGHDHTHCFLLGLDREMTTPSTRQGVLRQDGDPLLEGGAHDAGLEEVAGGPDFGDHADDFGDWKEDDHPPPLPVKTGKKMTITHHSLLGQEGR